jgi:regulatory protein
MTVPGGGDDAASSSAPARRRRPEPSPLQRALGLLTRREHSRQELGRKLVSRGVDSGDAQAAIDKLAAAGWQDDARCAESVVRSRASAGYGPAFIRAELGTHGLASDAIALAMETFEGDWTGNARDLLARRHPGAQAGDRAAQRKAMDLLLRRGFSMEQARAALRPTPDAGGEGGCL